MTAKPRPHAEVLAELVSELIDQVTTTEDIPRHRAVWRGRRRIAVPDMLRHRVIEVGLLDQLEAVADRPGGRLMRVPVMTTVTETDTDGNTVHRRAQQRVPVLDDRGQPMTRPRWDPERKRTVDTPVTMPLTRLQRAPGPGTSRPGAAVPGGSPAWDADGALALVHRGGAASSREPVTEATGLLMHIHRDARRVYARLLAAAGNPPYRRGLDAILRHMVALVAEVDERTAAAVVAATRRWVSAARLQVGYDAPVVRLRDIVCPDCGGPLHVRSDASTPVWCTGRWTVEGPALPGDPWPIQVECGLTYPRHTWPDLFAAGDTPEEIKPPKTTLTGRGELEGYGGRP